MAKPDFAPTPAEFTLGAGTFEFTAGPHTVAGTFDAAAGTFTVETWENVNPQDPAEPLVNDQAIDHFQDWPIPPGIGDLFLA
jgi:hypothetical protein